MVFLFGLLRRRGETRRRLGRLPDEDLRPRRASRHAFLLIPPACLIAHLGSLLLGTRLPVASGIKVGELLNYLLLIWMALVAGLNPLFSSINKILIDFTATGARSDMANHITPAQTGHVRLCFMQKWQL